MSRLTSVDSGVKRGFSFPWERSEKVYIPKEKFRRWDTLGKGWTYLKGPSLSYSPVDTNIWPSHQPLCLEPN